MTKVAAGLIFYEDAKSLVRCLDSLDNFDCVICVDGRFSEFTSCANEAGLSDTGTREIVESYRNTLLIDYPRRDEVRKRNAYLQLAKEYDWLLVIDSDE